MKTLNETKTMMMSDNYKERFVAEYWQTKIRYEKLKAFCNKIEASSYSMNVEEPKHDCTLGLLKEQQCAMGQYLHILEIRAVIEGVDLFEEVTEADNRTKGRE